MNWLSDSAVSFQRSLVPMLPKSSSSFVLLLVLDRLCKTSRTKDEHENEEETGCDDGTTGEAFRRMPSIAKEHKSVSWMMHSDVSYAENRC